MPIVQGRNVPGNAYAGGNKRNAELAYKNVEWAFRNDFWSNQYFRGHPNRSDANSVQWTGNRSRSTFLSFKRRLDDSSVANFDVMSYAIVPVGFSAQTWRALGCVGSERQTA